MRHLLIVAVIVGVATLWEPRLSALELGDRAPDLTSVTWVKGAAVKPEGLITVVEFWATWCPPCRESIPHLTSLQKKYHDTVQIVGLSNEEPGTVKPFVDAMGAKMDYHVGIADAATAEKYMQGHNGIPYAFLIDTKGVVVWTGHPGYLAETLAQLVAGTFDPAKVKHIASLQDELQTLMRAKPAVVSAISAKANEILAIDPVNLEAIGVNMSVAAYLKKPALVRETLIKVPVADLSAEQGNELASSRALDNDFASRNLDLALAFIGQSLKLEPNNADNLDTFARIEY
jgi:thiol-disulfide isomerase/thioredoxin